MEDISGNEIKPWNENKQMYELLWLEQKNEFKEQICCNFTNLINNLLTGKQEIFQLNENKKKESLFLDTFLEMFESRYAPHIGETIGGIRKLYITLPYNYRN